MADTIQLCSADPPPSDECEKLLKEINDLINRNKRALGDDGTHGLSNRFPEQIWGRNGPGTESWDNHEKAIKEQQRGLEKRLKNYKDKGCGPPPSGAWDWATRPVPQPDEWRGPATLPSTKEVATAGAEVAGGAVALYVLYRVIRMIPSLFPPLWPTIPANAAVP